MYFPSGLHMPAFHKWSWVFSLVTLRTARVAQSIMATSVEGEVFGLYWIARNFPLGDHSALVSEISGVFVRFTTAPPLLGIAKRSYISPPPRSDWKTIHLPSGDQEAPDCRSSDWLN